MMLDHPSQCRYNEDHCASKSTKQGGVQMMKKAYVLVMSFIVAVFAIHGVIAAGENEEPT